MHDERLAAHHCRHSRPGGGPDERSVARIDTVRRASTGLVVALLVAGLCYSVAAYLGARPPGFTLSAAKGFRITSTLYASTCAATPTAKLGPGLPRCLAVSVHNPMSVPIEVRSLRMAVTSFTPTPSNHHAPACAASMLSAPTTLTATFDVPARGSTDVDVKIELTTTGTQDACENGVFGLAFSGSATYTEATTTTLRATGTGHRANLAVTVVPANPSSDPYGPAGAPVHHVDFYSCGTTAGCRSKTLLERVTLAAPTGATMDATAAMVDKGLSKGDHYFEVVYPATGTRTGTFSGSISNIDEVRIPRCHSDGDLRDCRPDATSR